jgi:hypothetical protein
MQISTKYYAINEHSDTDPTERFQMRDYTKDVSRIGFKVRHRSLEPNSKKNQDPQLIRDVLLNFDSWGIESKQIYH